jgi:hypothetical protein
LKSKIGSGDPGEEVDGLRTEGILSALLLFFASGHNERTPTTPQKNKSISLKTLPFSGFSSSKFFYSISNELLLRYTSFLGRGMAAPGGEGPFESTSSNPPPKMEALMG